MESKVLKKVLSLSMAVLMAIPMVAYSAFGLIANAEEEYVPVAVGKTLGECFPDPEFAGYVYKNVLKYNNNDANDYILTKADVNIIKAVTKVDVSDMRTIEDLTGIQIFKSLEYLYCSETGITNLDVSQNINLKSLDCSYTRVTNLDVSQNTNLLGLNCSNTGITNLDVTQNINLKSLDCSYTRVTNLNVTQNIDLRNLDCSYTRVTNLDVTQNINLRSLNCSNNKITNLDVTKNINLEIFDCSDTCIISLDLSQNVKLIILDCSNTNMTIPIAERLDEVNLKFDS